MLKLSVIIKAYNEEANIARAIESALGAAAPWPSEVILADSASSDQTIVIAGRYPITVVRLLNPGERCCGVGPQLGFQHSRGELVLIADGDMEIDAEFVRSAIARMDEDATLAAIGGFVREMRAENLEFRSRVNRQSRATIRKETEVDHLAGGGLYRRVALQDVGYMSDRNLHGFEEFDLGVRLRSKGWRLLRLPDRAADHYSYRLSSAGLLLHRLRNGSFLSQGEVVRAALANGYVTKLVAATPGLKLAIAVWTYWLLAVAAALVLGPAAILAALLALAAPIALMGWRHGSIALGAFAVLVWHLTAIGLVAGFVKRRRIPNAAIDSVVSAGMLAAAGPDGRWPPKQPMRPAGRQPANP